MLKVGDEVYFNHELSVEEIVDVIALNAEDIRDAYDESDVGVVVKVDTGIPGLNYLVYFDRIHTYWYSEEHLVVYRRATDRLFATLGRSIIDFYARFGLVPAHVDSANALTEEVGEFILASGARVYYSSLPDQSVPNFLALATRHAADEFADALYTLVGLAVSADLTPQQLSAAVSRAFSKNDDKTLETHEVVVRPDGARKIQRKERWPA